MTTEIDRLDPVPTHVELSTGLVIDIHRLKTREVFKFMRILTRGAGPFLGSLDFSAPSDEFFKQLMFLIGIALPEAEEEAIDFIKAVTTPTGLKENVRGQKLSPADREHNESRWVEYFEAIENPEIIDTVSIVDRLIEIEAEDFQALGKKIEAVFLMAKKTGQIPEPSQQETTSQPTDSQAPSSEHSTSSSPSTDGPVSVS